MCIDRAPSARDVRGGALCALLSGAPVLQFIFPFLFCESRSMTYAIWIAILLVVLYACVRACGTCTVHTLLLPKAHMGRTDPEGRIA